jgi:dTDP-4-dehydrorhamnose 3,5-epimerase
VRVIFRETPLPGAFEVECERIEDQRGFFARCWCKREFGVHGLRTDLVQCSISFNRLRGTLRGLHYQISPHAEAKLVRCTMGAVYDVIVDLRPDSGTYLKWFASELTAGNRKMMYIPEGFAHGFQTLCDETEIFYQMSEYHAREHADVIRWDDTRIGIPWPMPPTVISERDLGGTDLN